MWRNHELPQIRKSGWCFWTSWRPQGTDCKHMVVDDNSEAIYKVGTAIELVEINPNLNQLRSLSQNVPYVGFISMTSATRLLHARISILAFFGRNCHQADTLDCVETGGRPMVTPPLATESLLLSLWTASSPSCESRTSSPLFSSPSCASSHLISSDGCWTIRWHKPHWAHWSFSPRFWVVLAWDQVSQEEKPNGRREHMYKGYTPWLPHLLSSCYIDLTIYDLKY